MLINLSNHPSDRWTQAQMQAAVQQYGSVTDVPFPIVEPRATTEQVQALALQYVHRCAAMIQTAQAGTHAVHVMGEMNFIYSFVIQAQKIPISCIASTTERNTVEQPDGSKVSQFVFVQFRAYM